MTATARWLIVLGVAAAPAVAQTTVRGEVRLGGSPAAGAVVQLLPIQPVDLQPPSDTAVIDQHHLRFTPSVLPVQAGGTVRFLNSDPIMHNVFSPQRRGAAFDLGTYPEGQSRTFTFTEPGEFVILCHVHPDMVAWVVVSPSPFFTVTDHDGAFRMSPVAAGAYQIRVWHQRRAIDAGTLDVPPDRRTLHVTVDR